MGTQRGDVSKEQGLTNIKKATQQCVAFFMFEMGGENAAELLHEQHLARSLDRLVEPSLVMRREPGVLAWQDSPLIGDKLPEQVRIFEVQRVNGEINLGLGTRRADFGDGRTAASAALAGFIGTCFTRHKLLDFAMKRVATQGRVVLFKFQLFGL